MTLEDIFFFLKLLLYDCRNMTLNNSINLCVFNHHLKESENQMRFEISIRYYVPIKFLQSLTDDFIENKVFYGSRGKFLIFL